MRLTNCTKIPRVWSQVFPSRAKAQQNNSNIQYTLINDLIRSGPPNKSPTRYHLPPRGVAWRVAAFGASRNFGRLPMNRYRTHIGLVPAEMPVQWPLTLNAWTVLHFGRAVWLGEWSGLDFTTKPMVGRPIQMMILASMR